jgi:hypothetical protein
MSYPGYISVMREKLKVSKEGKLDRKEFHGLRTATVRAKICNTAVLPAPKLMCTGSVCMGVYETILHHHNFVNTFIPILWFLFVIYLAFLSLIQTIKSKKLKMVNWRCGRKLLKKYLVMGPGFRDE